MKLRIAAALLLLAALVLHRAQRQAEPKTTVGSMKITAGVGDSRPPKAQRPETLTTLASRPIEGGAGSPTYSFKSSATTGFYSAPKTGNSRFLMLAASSRMIATFTPIRRYSLGGCVSSLVITGRTDTISVRLRCPNELEGDFGPLVEWMVEELNRRIPPPK